MCVTEVKPVGIRNFETTRGQATLFGLPVPFDYETEGTEECIWTWKGRWLNYPDSRKVHKNFIYFCIKYREGHAVA
jgi:hypothetical protein